MRIGTQVGASVGPAVGARRVPGGWPAFAAVSTNGIVNAIMPDGQGGCYAVGAFSTVTAANGTFSRGRGARFDAAGNCLPWNPGANSILYAMCAVSSGIIVAGSASNFNGNTRNNKFALVDADTGADLGWNPSGTASGIYAVATLPNDVVVFGGQFTTMGGSSRNRIAAFDLGGPLLPWNPNASSTVYALAASEDGSAVYVGGAFVTIVSQPRARLAMVNWNGGLAQLNTNFNANITSSQVNSLSLKANGGDLAVSGGFTSPSYRYMTVNPATGAQTSPPHNTTPGSGAPAIAWSGDELVIAVNSPPYLLRDGLAGAGWEAYSGFPGAPRAFAPRGDGSVFIGRSSELAAYLW